VDTIQKEGGVRAIAKQKMGEENGEKGISISYSKKGGKAFKRAKKDESSIP